MSETPHWSPVAGDRSRGEPPRTAGGERYLRSFWVTRRIRLLWIFILGFGALALFTLVLGDTGWLRIWDLGRQQSALEKEVATLESELGAVEADLSEPLPLQVERAAREAHLMNRPGEVTIIYQEAGPGESAGPFRDEGEAETETGTSGPGSGRSKTASR